MNETALWSKNKMRTPNDEWKMIHTHTHKILVVSRERDTRWQNISKTTGDIHVLHCSSTTMRWTLLMKTNWKFWNRRRVVMARDTVSLLRLSHDNYIHMHACTLLLLFRKEKLSTANTAFLFFLPIGWLAISERMHLMRHMQRSSWVFSIFHSNERWLLWFNFYLIMTFNAVDVVFFFYNFDWICRAV